MAVVFPIISQDLRYNRVVKDLNGLSPEQFLARIWEKFEVSAAATRQPSQPASFGMYLEGQWYIAQGAPEAIPPMTRSNGSMSDLQDNLLSPVLGIHDPRTDKRIDFRRRNSRHG